MCLLCGNLIFSNSLPFSLVMHGLPNCQKCLSHRKTPPHKVTVLPPLPTHAEAILLPMQRCPLAARRAAPATLSPPPPCCRRCCCHCCAAAASTTALPPPSHCHHRCCTDVVATAAALLPPPLPTLSSYSSLSPSLSSLL